MEAKHEHGNENQPKGLRATLWPSCKEMSHHSSHELDAPLGFWQKIGCSIHLLLCRYCRRYRGQLKFLSRVAHECPPPNLSQGRLPPAARERLIAAVRSNKSSGQPPQSPPNR